MSSIISNITPQFQNPSLFLQPLITNIVAFAIKYKKQNWNKVIFSDETTFQMFRNTPKIFYKNGTQPPSEATIKHPYKVHAFSVKGPAGFFLFTDIMGGTILTENLFDNANAIMGNNWMFH